MEVQKYAPHAVLLKVSLVLCLASQSIATSNLENHGTRQQEMMGQVLEKLEELRTEMRDFKKWSVKVEKALKREVEMRNETMLITKQLEARIDSLKSETTVVQREAENQGKEIDSLKNRTTDLLGQLTQFFVSHSNHSSDVDNGPASFSDKQPPAEVMELKITATGGTTYVRWGRTVCSGDAKRLYHGHVAGSRHNSAGGGSNVLCLHGQPEWTHTGGGSSSIVGIEYQFNPGPFSLTNNGGRSLLYNDIPCALCHVEIRTHQVMIPGRASCPAGWTLEYWGYILSSGVGHQKSEYYCVDDSPEVAAAGSAHVSTAGFAHPVLLECIALPCPPYFGGRSVSCVVCSK